MNAINLYLRVYFAICSCFYLRVYCGGYALCPIVEGQHFYTELEHVNWDLAVLSGSCVLPNAGARLAASDRLLQSFAGSFSLGYWGWTAVGITTSSQCCIWPIVALYMMAFFYSVKEIIHSDCITFYYLSHLKTNVSIQLSYRAPTDHREWFNEEM